MAGRVQEAMQERGLDFVVRSVPLWYHKGNGEGYEHLETNRALAIMDDDGNPREILSVVGNRFQFQQPVESFSWIDGLLEEYPGSVINRAGRHGSKVWVSVSLPNEKEAIAGDVIKQSVVIFDDYGGGSSYRIAVRNVRLVCSNGMTSHGEVASFTVKHVGDFRHKVRKAVRGIQAAMTAFERDLAVYREWADVPISVSVAEEAYAAWLSGASIEEASVRLADQSKRRVRNLDNVLHRYFRGVGARPGNVWGWYNGCTNYLTWAFTEDQGRQGVLWSETRVRDLEQRAIELATTMAT